MFKSTLLLLLSCIVCLIFSSSVSEVPPDPTVYSKKLFEVLKKNDQALYISSFEITDADIDLLNKLALEDPYISKSEMKRFQDELSDKSSLKKKLNERLNKNYTKVQEWIIANDIHINTIEYLTFYYTLQIEKGSPFYSINSGALYIKHGTKKYLIKLDNALYINNQWKYGEIDQIEEVNEYLNYVDAYSDYVDYANEDSIYVETYDDYDTAVYAVVDTAYISGSEYNRTFSEKETKKIFKIQEKIDALNKKLDKVYRN
ncbi:hypothetical protein [uncultured Cytophaga sp.]|uniref:hypothetical protein n=1 Tax=uncultured Cytophaga sp. TaxID=160238 RepID=UPI0026266843|nr:hypothetical protein [uncultured Cytophaga sp.]